MTQSFLNKGELGEILVIRKLFEYSKINDTVIKNSDFVRKEKKN